MEGHIAYINKFCRFCKKEVKDNFTVEKLADVINFCYRKDNVDIKSDEKTSQSRVMCRGCYKNFKKGEEEMKHLKKNPNSSMKFSYKIPVYSENVIVHHELCQCRESIPKQHQADATGCTPSKVMKLSEEPLESPSDKLTAREVKAKTPTRRSIKFLKWAGDDVAFDNNNEAAGDSESVRKVYIAQDSFHPSRISNMEIGKFFICRVCGQFPQTVKYSMKCHHMYCKTCIENYKLNVDSTKCPPSFIDTGHEDSNKCIVPSSPDDIQDISGFIKEIFEALGVKCRNQHCKEVLTVNEVSRHDAQCKVRGAYTDRSLMTTKYEPLRQDASKAIDYVINWSQEHRVSPCDFLFFALKRLISKEAPSLEESVQQVFKIFLQKAEPAANMTPLEGLALKIGADLSNSQYQKLRRNKMVGEVIPSLVRVTKAKEMLDPGNVEYKVFLKSGGQEVEHHKAQPNSGIIDVDDDLGPFSYGDLNINVQGCRATLHDTIAKLFEEKYLEIESWMIEKKVYDSIQGDPDREVKVYVKVCLDGTTAAVKSAKGASRLPIPNWLRGTVGIVGAEITWHGDLPEVEHSEPAVNDDENVLLNSVSNLDVGTIADIINDLPERLKNMSLREIVSKSRM